MRSLRLALADLRREPAFTLCSVLAMAAVIAPLILLAGLRAGVVAGLKEDLSASPRTREIANVQNLALDPAWFAALAARPETGFLIPRTRLLAATGSLEAAAQPGRVATVEILPTAPGDPLLPGIPAATDRQVIVTAAAAQRLSLRPGDALRLRIIRRVGEGREVLALDLTALAIAPAGAFDRDAIFAPPALGRQVQDFLDDRAADGSPRRAEGFRLHARRLEDVPALVALLQEQGIETRSRAEDVAALLALDRNLTAGFAVIATVGAAGFVLGLGAALWASVSRKRRTLSLLRLMGLRQATLVMIPVWQGIAYALGGSIAGTALAIGAAQLVNRLALLGPAEGRDLARIGLGELGLACLLATSAAILASAAAAQRAAGADPAEGLRDE
ncbi:ABC transporter permease [Falsiroseomonas ponticola]|uniref:ABC transporter permease n=1 Tax=Falsiroseomonas ponticola TaxID=2786951 RepID=UPI0019320C41|nr:FtsX-like permease family protein [Roseomonas ponticola]